MIPTTKIERHFKIRHDGLYQEVLYHLIVYKNPNNTERQTVTDKVIVGNIYREAAIHEHSFLGEAEFTDSQGIVHRLVGLHKGPNK